MTGPRKPPESRETTRSCFFCAAAEVATQRPLGGIEGGRHGGIEEGKHLLVHSGEHHLVMLNRHPYSSGHLMVAPLEHIADPADAEPAVQSELWQIVLNARAALEVAYSPDGMNLGMNLGSAAGAGVPGHFHFHLVPRWKNDANFMAAVGNVRLVPEDLDAARERLVEIFNERYATTEG